MNDMSEAISRGDHKSALTRSCTLLSNVKKEFRIGFQFPFLPEDITKIKGTVVAACRMMVQWNIDEEGKKVPKHRLTHDQTFDYSEGNSINHRLIKENLPELFYSFFCFALHCVHSL